MEQSEVEEKFATERQEDGFQDVCRHPLRCTRIPIHQNTDDWPADGADEGVRGEDQQQKRDVGTELKHHGRRSGHPQHPVTSSNAE